MLCCNSNDAVVNTNQQKTSVKARNKKYANQKGVDGSDSFRAKDHAPNYDAFFAAEQAEEHRPTPPSSHVSVVSESREDCVDSPKVIDQSVSMPVVTKPSKSKSYEEEPTIIDKKQSFLERMSSLGSYAKPNPPDPRAGLVSTISYESDDISTCYSEKTPLPNHTSAKSTDTYTDNGPQSPDPQPPTIDENHIFLGSMSTDISERKPSNDTATSTADFVTNDTRRADSIDMKGSECTTDSLLHSGSNWTEPSWMLRNNTSKSSAVDADESVETRKSKGDDSVTMTGCLDVMQDNMCGLFGNNKAVN